jgi:hypothetical protein
MDTIRDPVGEAIVYWRTAEEGGRKTGLPTVPVYTPITVFVLGGEEEVQPGWPWTADPVLSICVERIAIRDDGSWLCRIGFLVPDLAVPYLVPGGKFLLMEGSGVVATAEFTVIYDR